MLLVVTGHNLRFYVAYEEIKDVFLALKKKWFCGKDRVHVYEKKMCSS